MSTKSLQVMSQYSTNLTDKQWQVTEKILDPNHRKRKYPLRETMNAIMYIVKTQSAYNAREAVVRLYKSLGIR